MRKNTIKSIVILAAILPCLSGCKASKYKEGELVKAECVFNGYEKLPDFSESFTLDVEDYKGLEVKAHGDYFYINDFKIYDSLYLADINGDGHRDFCTDFLYNRDINNHFHGYAFYDMENKTYLEYYLPTNYMSYYLGERDGALIVKEFFGQHDVENYKANKFHSRTATLLTAKEKPNLVWKDDEFEFYDYSIHMYNVDNGTIQTSNNPEKEYRYLCATDRVNDLYFFYTYAGILDKDSKFANDCADIESGDGYEVAFNNEKTASMNKTIDGTFITWYTITFKKEGVFHIKIAINGIEHVLDVEVDNDYYYGK